MENYKGFKENYKYNAKKVLQILEKDNSGQNNHKTKENINEEKEKE